MASFKKNKSGTYTATIFLCRDPKGKMIKEYITDSTLREAKKAALKRENELMGKKRNDAAAMKFSDYALKWLELESCNLVPSTIKAYRQYIKNHFIPYFNNIKLGKITETNIKEYIAEKSKILSSTTVRKHFFTLSKMLKDALKGNSPCIGIKPPPNAEFKPRILTDEEFNALWHTFEKYSLLDAVIILLAGWCGMRRGEVFALKWNDFNETAGTIRIDEAIGIAENDYSFEIKGPKSKNGFRTLVLPNLLKEFLTKLRCNAGENDLIVSYNAHTYSKRFDKIIYDNKLPKVRYHDLRHYHASMMYKNQIPDLYAAERLGHDIMVLKKIYQHLDLKVKNEIDDKIKDMFEV